MNAESLIKCARSPYRAAISACAVFASVCVFVCAQRLVKMLANARVFVSVAH